MGGLLRARKLTFLNPSKLFRGELGDEIRMRILSGVGSSYDIALKNPAGMVALVEAVEVYERAADQYKKFIPMINNLQHVIKITYILQI